MAVPAGATLTRSPTLVAGLTVTVTLPWLLFALPAGVFVDRLDRRRAMLGANLVRAAVLTLLALAVLLDLGSFAMNAMMAVLVLYAVGPESGMGLAGPAFGLLLATVAAGSLAGSFIAAWVERKLGKARALGLTMLGTATLIGTPALTANPFVIGAAFLTGGVGIVIWNVIVVSQRQRITPDRLLGRVNSGYRLVAWGAMPFGAAAGGLLAQLFGLRAVFAIMALLLLVALAAAAHGRGFPGFVGRRT